MRFAILTSLATATLLAACTQQAKQAEPKTDEEKALYAMGAVLARNIQAFELSDQELNMVKSGLADGAKDQSKMKPEELDAIMPKIRELGDARMKASSERAKKEGEEYLAKAATEAGAEKTASGMIYKQTKEGTGASPTAADNVKVHYEGRLISGKVFDSSKERGEPAEFPLGQVIGCWTEGVQKMKVGGTAQLTCPAELAYGEQGQPPTIPGNSTLVFDVELLDIVKEEPQASPAP
jgi:FKBP-type peptidyl-prolyl cis-trans isomerase FkpA